MLSPVSSILPRRSGPCFQSMTASLQSLFPLRKRRLDYKPAVTSSNAEAVSAVLKSYLLAIAERAADQSNGALP
ncbi:hypothetical protein PSAB6_100004 [Paraburkholderia sabiae]|nr:hypothetical protein PSAB6_100004 [Paraburkholderia sabiae]